MNRAPIKSGKGELFIDLEQEIAGLPTIPPFKLYNLGFAVKKMSKLGFKPAFRFEYIHNLDSNLGYIRYM